MTKPLKLVAANDTVSALLALADVLAGKQALFVTAPEVNGLMPDVHGLSDAVEDDVALIVESSGSTGVAKRIYISRDALIASATATENRLGGAGQWLLALPINFIAGAQVLVRSLLAETQPVIMNTSVAFTAEAFARAASLMSAQRRYTSLVPTQLARIAANIDGDDYLLAVMRKFDAVLVGGQAPQSEVVEKLKSFGVKIVVTYGMTETCGGCVYDGVALDGVNLAIEPDSRISISGDVLANGLGAKFITNDLGEIVDGKLRVLGRTDRVIASGGIKVSLDRVEELARTVPGVVEIAATAVDDSEWGQRVGLLYLGSPEVADFVVELLASELGPVGKPVQIIRADRVPKLANGKYDLVSIKQLFEKSKND